MFFYEKYYTQLWRKQEKIPQTGLMKIFVWDKRIKVDLFFDHIPFLEQISGVCTISYFAEGDEKMRKLSWLIVLGRHQCHYSYQKTINDMMQKVVGCEIQLEKDYVIKEQDVETVTKQQNTEAVIKKQEKKAERGIQKITNLKDLFYKGSQYEDLYYNSFLLHSFYQYRYCLEGEGFLGAPGNFYEREAIAAKLMGFPFFLEEQYIEQFEKKMFALAKPEQKNTADFRSKPAEGCFGYYLRPLMEESI